MILLALYIMTSIDWFLLFFNFLVLSILINWVKDVIMHEHFFENHIEYKTNIAGKTAIPVAVIILLEMIIYPNGWCFFLLLNAVLPVVYHIIIYLTEEPYRIKERFEAFDKKIVMEGSRTSYTGKRTIFLDTERTIDRDTFKKTIEQYKTRDNDKRSLFSQKRLNLLRNLEGFTILTLIIVWNWRKISTIYLVVEDIKDFYDYKIIKGIAIRLRYTRRWFGRDSIETIMFYDERAHREKRRKLEKYRDVLYMIIHIIFYFDHLNSLQIKDADLFYRIAKVKQEQLYIKAIAKTKGIKLKEEYKSERKK